MKRDVDYEARSVKWSATKITVQRRVAPLRVNSRNDTSRARDEWEKL